MSSTHALGCSLALNGPEMNYGQQMLHALEMAVEDENMPSLKLRIEDDGSEEGQARAAAERLASDPQVFAVVGPMNSWTCEAESPVYSQAGLVQMTPSASSPDLCRQGWKTLFRMCPNDIVQGNVLARVAHELVQAKRVAAVHDRTAFGKPLAQVFLDESCQRGLQSECLTDAKWGEEGSFLKAAQSIVKYEPDAVFIVGLEKPCQKLARVLRDEGFEGVFLGTDAIKPTKVLVTPGFSGPGPYLTNSGISALHQAPEFHRRFESRFGPHHSVYTIEAYDAARMLIQLLRRVKKVDRTEIHQSVLRETGYQGLGGQVRFDEQGERVEPEMGIYRFEGSELKFLGTQRTVFDS